MVNTKTFKAILECAYDLEVLRFHSEVNRFYCKNNGYGFVQKCDILTNIGGLHITLHEGHFAMDKFINAKIKTSIKLYSKECIADLIKTQCETEAFLSYDDYEKYGCECSLIK